VYGYTYANQDIILEEKTQGSTTDTREYIYGQGVDDVEVMIWNGARYGYVKDRQ